MKKNKLEALVRSLDVDGLLLMNLNGELLDAVNINHEGNIAAMTNVFYTMVQELSQDLNIGDSNQIICKSENGFYIVHKYESEILCVCCKDVAKIGYAMTSLKTIELEK